MTSAKQYPRLRIHSGRTIISHEIYVMSVTPVAVATHVVTRQLIKHNPVCQFSTLLCFHTTWRKCFSLCTRVNNNYLKSHYTPEGAVCCDYGGLHRCRQLLFATPFLPIITTNDALVGSIVNFHTAYFVPYSWVLINPSISNHPLLRSFDQSARHSGFGSISYM